MYSQSSITNAKYLTKRLAKAMLGRDHMLFPDVSLPKLRLGTNYGGWFVAPGALPRGRQPVVLSCGIGDDISFDIEMISRYDARIYAFDPTPKSIAWLAKQTETPESFKAFPYGVANCDGTQNFSLPTVPEWDDYSIRRESTDQVACVVKRISTIVSELGLEQIDIIKMDIEGSEYDVLKDLCAGPLRPAQLLVEFHHGRDDIPVSETKEMVQNLKANSYRIFDVSPWGREFSFVHEAGLAGMKDRG
jgi:FkbM family methyltransferase